MHKQLTIASVALLMCGLSGRVAAAPSNAALREFQKALDRHVETAGRVYIAGDEISRWQTGDPSMFTGDSPEEISRRLGDLRASELIVGQQRAELVEMMRPSFARPRSPMFDHLLGTAVRTPLPVLRGTLEAVKIHLEADQLEIMEKQGRGRFVEGLREMQLRTLQLARILLDEPRGGERPTPAMMRSARAIDELLPARRLKPPVRLREIAMNTGLVGLLDGVDPEAFGEVADALEQRMKKRNSAVWSNERLAESAMTAEWRLIQSGQPNFRIPEAIRVRAALLKVVSLGSKLPVPR